MQNYFLYLLQVSLMVHVSTMDDAAAVFKAVGTPFKLVYDIVHYGGSPHIESLAVQELGGFVLNPFVAEL